MSVRIPFISIFLLFLTIFATTIEAKEMSQKERSEIAAKLIPVYMLLWDDNTIIDSDEPDTNTDTTPPVISIAPGTPSVIYKYSSFEKPTASATDNYDKNVDIVESGEVDTTKEGVYTITYTATDKAGNSLKKSVTVEVKGAPDAQKIKDLTAAQKFKDASALFTEKVFIDTINMFEDKPTKAIKLLNKYPEMKKALASTVSSVDSPYFTIRNLEFLLRKFDEETVKNYRNVFFGYAVQSANSKPDQRAPFWDGWGGHIGHYGSKRVWSHQAEIDMEKDLETFRQNGYFKKELHKNSKDIAFYAAQKYKLFANERVSLERFASTSPYWSGKATENLRKAIDDGVDLENCDLVTTLPKYKIGLQDINAWLKVNGKPGRKVSELKPLIEDFLATNTLKTKDGSDIRTYKDIVLNPSIANPKLAEKLGALPSGWSGGSYLNYAMGWDGTPDFDYSSAEYEIRNIISLDKRPKTKFDRTYGLKEQIWPLGDDFKQRPWQVYALDSGTDQDTCEEYQGIFFENDESKRMQKYEDFVGMSDPDILTLDWSKKEEVEKRRLHTYGSWGYTWNYAPKVFYSKHRFHNQWSIPSILQQGGVCSAMGALGQFTRSCVGLSTMGRHEPGHRSYVWIKPLENGKYRALVEQGSLPSSYYGSTYPTYFIDRASKGEKSRSNGIERLRGIVSHLQAGNNGFGSQESDNLIKLKLTEMLEDQDKRIEIYSELAKADAGFVDAWYHWAAEVAETNPEELFNIIKARKDLIKDGSPLYSRNPSKTTDNVDDMIETGIVQMIPEVAMNESNSHVDTFLKWNEVSQKEKKDITPYLRMFKKLKDLYKVDDYDRFLEDSKKLWTAFIENNELTRVGFSFPAKSATDYWATKDNPQVDFIAQRKFELDNSTASAGFKRQIGSDLFKVLKTIPLWQITSVPSNIGSGAEKLGANFRWFSDEEFKKTKKIFFTVEGISQVKESEVGTVGSSVFPVEFKDSNNEIVTINVRAAIIKDDKTYRANDMSIEAKEGWPQVFRFWIENKDNLGIKDGVYKIAKPVVVNFKGKLDSTDYSIETRILDLKPIQFIHSSSDEDTETANTSIESFRFFYATISRKEPWQKINVSDAPELKGKPFFFYDGHGLDSLVNTPKSATKADRLSVGAKTKIWVKNSNNEYFWLNVRVVRYGATKYWSAAGTVDEEDKDHWFGIYVLPEDNPGHENDIVSTEVDHFFYQVYVLDDGSKKIGAYLRVHLAEVDIAGQDRAD